jgi:hypothetical protein
MPTICCDFPLVPLPPESQGHVKFGQIKDAKAAKLLGSLNSSPANKTVTTLCILIVILEEIPPDFINLFAGTFG